MAKRDYYEILGISKTSSDEEIKKAYRSLAKKYHPDVNKAPDAEIKFKEVNEAYEVLSDRNKRRMYDQYGHQAMEHASGFGGSGSPFEGFGGFNGFGDIDLGDIFGSFFGSGGGSRNGRTNNRPRKGNNYESRIKISFIDSVLGKTIEENLNKNEICSSCKGSGAESESDIITCDECNGSGQIKIQRRTPLGVMSTTSTCGKCNGLGKIIRNKCKTCKGQRFVTKNVKTKITIPAGIKNGREIIVEGFGAPGINGGPSGDLIIVVFVENHKYYTRVNDDIHIDLPVSFIDIINESLIKIPTPYGVEKITLASDIKTGDVLTIKNKGFKVIGTKRSGDLKLHVNIYIPKLSKKEREKLSALVKDIKDDQYQSWLSRVGENK